MGGEKTNTRLVPYAADWARRRFLRLDIGLFRIAELTPEHRPEQAADRYFVEPVL